MVFNENETNSYVIEQITADYKEDIANVIGVVRCTAITIKSNAPLVHNSRAQIELYNIFADIEYNNRTEERLVEMLQLDYMSGDVMHVNHYICTVLHTYD